MPVWKPALPTVGTPLPALLGSLGLERRLAVHQGLGKWWLPASPRFPPLLGCRAAPLLMPPFAKRENPSVYAPILPVDVYDRKIGFATLRRQRQTGRQVAEPKASGIGLHPNRTGGEVRDLPKNTSELGR